MAVLPSVVRCSKRAGRGGSWCLGADTNETSPANMSNLALSIESPLNWKQTNGVDQSNGHVIWFAYYHTARLSEPVQTWVTPLNSSPQRAVCAGGFPNLEFNFCICSDSKWWIFAFNGECVWSSLFLAADYIWINQVIIIMQHVILQPLKLRHRIYESTLLDLLGKFK